MRSNRNRKPATALKPLGFFVRREGQLRWLLSPLAREKRSTGFYVPTLAGYLSVNRSKTQMLSASTWGDRRDKVWSA